MTSGWFWRFGVKINPMTMDDLEMFWFGFMETMKPIDIPTGVSNPLPPFTTSQWFFSFAQEHLRRIFGPEGVPPAPSARAQIEDFEIVSP